MREAFDNGGFTHACFAEKHWIIFRAAAKHLNDALNFAGATNDRIHIALARDFRQVATKCLERGRFNFALFLRTGGSGFFRSRFTRLSFFLAALLGGKIWIQFFQDALTGFLNVHVQRA